MKSFKYIVVISIIITVTINPALSKHPTFEFFDIYDNISLGGYVKETSHTMMKPNRLSYSFALNKNATQWLLKLELHMLTKNERRIALSKTDVDFCQYGKWTYKNKFFSVILKEMVRTSNFPKRCQLEADKAYYINNYTLRNTDYPEQTPELTFLISMEAYFNQRSGLMLFIKGRVTRD